MNVVGRLIAGDDFEFLVDVHRQHMRNIHATFLVEDWLFRGNRTGLVASEALRDINHHVLQCLRRNRPQRFPVWPDCSHAASNSTGPSTCRCPSCAEPRRLSSRVPVMEPVAAALDSLAQNHGPESNTTTSPASIAET